MSKIRKNFSKGFTFVELLIALALGVVLITASIIFFTDVYKKFYKQISLAKMEMAVLNAIQLINSDLKKAGYGIPDTNIGIALCYNHSHLIIRYIDYTKSECKNAIWPNSTCAYQIEYYLNNYKIYRKVIRGGTGSGVSSRLFNNTKFENFYCEPARPIGYYWIVNYRVSVVPNFFNITLSYNNSALIINRRNNNHPIY